MSALNKVFSSLVPLHMQESESVLTVICTKYLAYMNFQTRSSKLEPIPISFNFFKFILA